ncbi:MAG: PilZ domain-containing protein [Candidatus Hydrogenedentes bacterium]|nr:PilZ domain-containing protein [Candidatus Hydrogenedentota bacterium]
MTNARYAKERRRSRRVLASGNLRFQYSPQEGGHARIIDVDLGGFCLETAATLVPGQRLMMELLSSDGSMIAELKGLVIWSVPADSRRTKAGVRVYAHDWDSQQALSALMSQGIASRNAVRWFAVLLPGSAGWRLRAPQEDRPASRAAGRGEDTYAPGFTGHLVSGL